MQLEIVPKQSTITKLTIEIKTSRALSGWEVPLTDFLDDKERDIKIEGDHYTLWTYENGEDLIATISEANTKKIKAWGTLKVFP